MTMHEAAEKLRAAEKLTDFEIKVIIDQLLGSNDSIEPLLDCLPVNRGQKIRVLEIALSTMDESLERRYSLFLSNIPEWSSDPKNYDKIFTILCSLTPQYLRSSRPRNLIIGALRSLPLPAWREWVMDPENHPKVLTMMSSYPADFIAKEPVSVFVNEAVNALPSDVFSSFLAGQMSGIGVSSHEISSLQAQCDDDANAFQNFLGDVLERQDPKSQEAILKAIGEMIQNEPADFPAAVRNIID